MLAETDQNIQVFVQEKLNATLIIVDEASMLDNHLASTLFSAIRAGTQIILVGDVDQLPSVGCGNVLREIISSKVIPVTRLNTIFRQAEGNAIIENSRRIRDGKLALEWTDSFVSVCANSPDSVYNKACALYLKCVEQEENGLDDVILLNPYRDKGEISTSGFNQRLQQMLNPPSLSKPEMKVGRSIFRMGDRVMQTMNTEFVSNGDIGTITNVCQKKDGNGKENPICRIRFADITVEYSRQDMEHVVLAYCTTIHKSQGAEYKTVIIVMHPSHRNMLRRNLIYTAVTRAVNRVAIVGTGDALETAINTDVVDRRNTKLSSRIRTAKGGSMCQEEIAPIAAKIATEICESNQNSELEMQCEI